jgi:XTP/dITP diphosphohydrolase
MKLVFATNNRHKIDEVKKLLPGPPPQDVWRSKPYIELLTLADIGCTEILPETGSSLHDNAAQKARYVHDKYGYDCFADDSGLEVEALDGRPGVYSAHYGGEHGNSTANVKKVLAELNQEENRKARFRTVIALVIKDETKYFDGEVRGEITLSARGSNGFGYDPIFIPEGFHVTFAEMAPELKNRISHRADAVKKLVEFITLINQN